MNQKKAKKIRKTLKHAGFNWRDREYNIKGSNMFTAGTVLLAKNCGRQIYRATKLLQKQRV